MFQWLSDLIHPGQRQRRERIEAAHRATALDPKRFERPKPPAPMLAAVADKITQQERWNTAAPLRHGVPAKDNTWNQPTPSRAPYVASTLAEDQAKRRKLAEEEAAKARRKREREEEDERARKRRRDEDSDSGVGSFVTGAILGSLLNSGSSSSSSGSSSSDNNSWSGGGGGDSGGGGSSDSWSSSSSDSGGGDGGGGGGGD